MTEAEEIQVRNRLWEAGFAGDQSAERGPVMLEIFRLIEEAKAEAEYQLVLRVLQAAEDVSDKRTIEVAMASGFIQVMGPIVERKEASIRHTWKKRPNFSYCSKCMVIKGSNPDKKSKCPGRPPMKDPE